jgi:hypothetical protein
MTIFGVDLLVILLAIIAVAGMTLVGSYALDRRKANKTTARFRSNIIGVLGTPKLFGGERGQCNLCGAMVTADEPQAQVVFKGTEPLSGAPTGWTALNLKIVSAVTKSMVQVFLPVSTGTRLTHLRCASPSLADRLGAMDSFQTNFGSVSKELPRHIAVHDFDDEKIFTAYVPANWRPGNEAEFPFNTDPEALLDWLLRH